MKKTVLVAMGNPNEFRGLVEFLENAESDTELEISQNIGSQAMLLYFLPKIKPHAVVLGEDLQGELSQEDLIARCKELSPETELIVYQGDLEAIGDSLVGKRELLGKIVAVWSPSGGVGKTEIAKNLALTAGQTYRVILLDANLCNPDIAEHLGLYYEQGKTLSAALQLWNEKRLTPGALRKILQPYQKISVLVGSEDTIEQTDYSPVFFRDLLRTLSQLADFVIADMDSDITSPAGISILLASHHVITPFSTVPSTLGHGKVYMDLLKESYQMNPHKFDPVLNRAGEGGSVSETDIEICMKRPVIATIPYRKEYLQSACKGSPLVLEKRLLSKKLSRTLQNVVRKYAQKDVSLG